MKNEPSPPAPEASEAPWPAERVIDTHLLKQRPSKAPNHRAESQEMLALVQTLATDPDAVVQRLVEAAQRLTGAGSAGLSLSETQEDGNEIFRWIATTGEYARYMRGTMPRHFSPCGEVLRRAEPLLMRDMVRAYPYVEKLHAPPVEVLLVPFAKDGALVGTIWIVGHSPDHTFDEEDLRVVRSLAVFASAVSGTVGLVRDLEARGDRVSRELETSERQRRQLDQLMVERDLAAQAMARELNDTRRLRDVAARLIGADGNHALLGEILDAALEITAADAGTIQLHDAASDSLSFLATRGFKPDIVEHFSRVDASSGSPCGIALATGRRAFIDFGTHLPDPDGSNRWHREAGIRSAQSTPLISRSGQPLGMFSTHWREARELSEREVRFLDLLGRQAADLIERIQAQEALRASERELREGARRKDEFLAVLAHELRNPLAPIRSGVELLRKVAHDPLVDKVRPMMERQVNHMVRLIDDLLDVSRISSGKVELKHQTVSLWSLVDSAVEANRGAIAAAGLQLELRVDDPDRQLSVDPTRMSQVLANILHNATKFTGSGGTITLATELAGAEQVFRVTDTGVGIAIDSLPTIFQLFTQIRPDSSQRHGGMGIGLALARSLVEMHGGTIDAESAGAGHGSTFVVRVPVGGGALQASAPERGPVDALAGLRVLVVDDNQDAADALGELLTQHGSKVRVAYLAEPALELLDDFDPSLVLLDIGLPTIDGYEACRRMREAKGAGVRVIALTGWGQEEDRRRATEAGFDAHLTKPVDLARLAAIAFR
jgi:signal transduction histidine kinase